MHQDGGIGQTHAPEWRAADHPDSSRRLELLTCSEAHNYPLYYFVTSFTGDGRYMVFHSERSGWVQLHRLDMQTGEIVQLTDGRTYDSGWGIWCEWHLRGIYNHLSAVNPVRDEAYYFQDEEIRCADVATIENRRVATLPSGRMPIGQSAFSPDGRHFAFLHADAERMTRTLRDTEALANMDQHRRPARRDTRKLMGGTVLGVIDTETGACRQVRAWDYHIHHVVFADDETMLLNHPEHHHGMLLVPLSGESERELRPPDAAGAMGPSCHQVITERGVFYEANHRTDAGHEVYVGLADHRSGEFADVRLGGLGYVHTGWDPAGRFLFFESRQRSPEPRHLLIALRFAHVPERRQVETLHHLRSCGDGGQRFHAHPLLSPDRRWMVFTDLAENGYLQVQRLDVSDLVDRPEYGFESHHRQAP